MKSKVVYTGEKIAVIDHKRTGQEMRRLREASGLSLRAIATRMGVSAPYISDLEKGFRKWTEERCSAFLSAINSESEI